MTTSEPHRFFPSPLTKRWFVLRHGRSEANEAGIVASRLPNAETRYGLTPAGRKEVAGSVQAAAGSVQGALPLLIIASPFLRTRQTADIAGDILGDLAAEQESDRRQQE